MSEIALLRARALLRLDRPDGAREAIASVFVAHGALDASLTAQMLLGAAEVRLGDVRQGLVRLQRAQVASAGAEPTIESEIALNRALAHYALHDWDAADRALDDVAENADIVTARALEYRGWIATARGASDAATASFTAALRRLDICRRHDRFLEANALRALAHLAAERFDVQVAAFIVSRVDRVDWTAGGLALPRYWITMSNALTLEAEGRVVDAVEAAYLAEELAPNEAYRVHAMCRRAALERGIGELFAEVTAVRSARRRFAQIDPASLKGDEKTVALVLAEELAHAGQVDDAQRHLALYCSLGPLEAVTSMSGDPRAAAYERLVEGTIAEAAGDRAGAHAGYTDAWRGFSRIGYHRRAVAAALRRAALTGEDALYQYAAQKTAGLSPRFWMRRELGGRDRGYVDPIIGKLTATQREVLVLVAAGHTSAEIAAHRGQAEQTIKNVTSKLLAAFSVPSRRDLIAEYRRRLGAKR